MTDLITKLTRFRKLYQSQHHSDAAAILGELLSELGTLTSETTVGTAKRIIREIVKRQPMRENLQDYFDLEPSSAPLVPSASGASDETDEIIDTSFQSLLQGAKTSLRRFSEPICLSGVSYSGGKFARIQKRTMETQCLIAVLVRVQETDQIKGLSTIDSDDLQILSQAFEKLLGESIVLKLSKRGRRPREA